MKAHLPKARFVVLLIVAALILVSAVWHMKTRDTASTTDTPTKSTPSPPGAETGTKSVEPSIPNDRQVSTTPPAGAPSRGPRDTIEQTLHLLDGLAPHNADTHERLKAVAALRTALRTAPASEAAAAITDFLNSHRDAPTGLVFAPARDGYLDTAPTLRTWLLDELERLDAKQAQVAASIVLASPDQPDEWAVALRIVGRTGMADSPDGRAYFLDRVEALLAQPDWLAKPTPGFLHAFDAGVFAGTPEIAESFAAIASSDAPEPVRFAARLAVERMIVDHFAATAFFLFEQPELLAREPRFRGSLFARADMREPADRAILAGFLSTPNTPPAEITAWTEYFPNNNLHLSNNLLTRGVPYSLADLADRDTAALDTLRSWLTDPNMQSVRTHLEVVARRLEAYVAASESKSSHSRTSP